MGSRRASREGIRVMFKRVVTRGRALAVAAVGAAVPLTLYAADQLNVFEAETAISSSAVNENFDILDARVGEYEAAISVDGETGNVGIGTTSPGQKFGVQGSGDVASFGSSAQSVYFAPDTGGVSLLTGAGQTGNGWYFDTNNNALRAYTNSAEKLRIDTSGNVGIGTTAPQAKLHVRGGTGAGDGSSFDPLVLQNTACNAGATTQMLFDIGDGSNGAGYGASIAAVDYGSFDTRLEFRTINSGGHNDTSLTSANTRMAVDADGNVGIGTMSPAARLDIAGTGNVILNARSTNPGWGGTSIAEIYNAGDTDNGVDLLHVYSAFQPAGLVVKTGGNVGIGTTSPSERLHVEGNVIADDYLANSDARLKTDVEPLQNAAEGIACLQGVSYRWSDAAAPQELQIGLIAQEVEACFPELVSTGPDGYKSVSYARLVAPLIENAKQQQALLGAQHDVNVSQQDEIAAQQDEIARLRAEQAATHADLAATRADLNATRADLAASRADLATTNARLARLEAALGFHR